MPLLQRFLHGSRWQVTDAEGVARPLYNQYQRGLRDDPHEDLPADEFRRIQGVVATCNGNRHLFWYAAVPVLLVLVCDLVDAIVRRAGFVMLAARVAILITLSLIARRFFVGDNPRYFAHAMLLHDRCPCCGYRLAIDRGSTNATRCTECGALWSRTTFWTFPCASCGRTRSEVARTAPCPGCGDETHAASSPP